MAASSSLRTTALATLAVLAASAGIVGPAGAQLLTNVATGDLAGTSLDDTAGTVRLTRVGTVLASAVAEMRPPVLFAGSTAQGLTCEIQATMDSTDTGFRRVELAVPLGFANPTITGVSVGGTPLVATTTTPAAGEYLATIGVDSVFVDLGARISTSLTRVMVGLTADVPSNAGLYDFGVQLVDGNLLGAVGPGDADGDPDNANGLTIQVVESQGVVLELETIVDRSEVVLGEVVTFTMPVRNLGAADVESVHVVTTLPPNFAYVEGSAHLDGDPVATAGGQALRFDLGTVLGLDDLDGDGRAGPGEPGFRQMMYQAVVGAGAKPGTWTGRAVATDYCNVCAISNEVTTEIDVLFDPDFDLGTIVGKVFRDDDHDGVQDPGEHGLPDVRVILDDATIARTDEFGRYHFPVVKPGHRLLKIDRATVPAAADSTSPQIRQIRVTPGLIAKVNFGVRVLEETVVIGSDEILGRAMVREIGDNSVEVRGNVTDFSLLVNGREVEIPKASVTLTQGGREGMVELRGEVLTEPVRFRPSLEASGRATGWVLAVIDSSGAELRTIPGEGEPPGEILWDGQVDRPTPIGPDEAISYALTVTFADGSSVTSPRGLAGVRMVSPVSFRISGDSYESGETALSGRARRALDEAAQVIRRHPGERIVVEGHTDNLGTFEHNLDLSAQRAQTAIDYLTGEHGLPRDQFSSRGLADTRPIASNATPEGRTLNRRVEIRAELEETVGEEIVRTYRTEPEVTINGEAVVPGEFGRFSLRIADISVSSLDVRLSGAEGMAWEATIPLPVFELQEPTGVRVLSQSGTNGDGDDHGLVTTLAGRTDPANEIRVDDVLLPLRSDGTIDRDFRIDEERNTFRIFVRNPQGFERVVNLSVDVAEFDESGDRWVASERIPPLEVRLPPEGEPLPGGRIEVRGSTEPGNGIQVNGETWTTDDSGAFRGTVDLAPHAGQLTVEVQDPDGSRGVVERKYAIEDPGLFLLAFADGKFSQLNSSGNLEAAGQDETSRLYSEGRVAYYLEGWIAGKYLVTSALDTGREELGSLFSDLGPDESQPLFRNLDPDRIYPVYGDESTLEWAAQSQGKFYLGVRSDEMQFLAGNYAVNLADTELAKYLRTLYGARFAYRSSSETRYGDPDTQVIAFGADVQLVNVRNEFAATGGSLYYLSDEHVVEGSEQVTLTVRDRNTQLVLSRELQRRNVDYNIKYPEGRLLFRRPIRTIVPDDATIVDNSALIGHPVFIEVDYEKRAQFLEETAAGVRARQQIGDHVAIGGTWVDDRQADGTYWLQGLDTELRAAESRVVAEYARSEGRDARTLVSPDGGMTWEEALGSPDREGDAWKVATELEIGEWFDRPDRVRLQAWYQEQDPGFAAAGRLLDSGRRRHGGVLDLRPLETGRLAVRYSADVLTDQAPATAAARTTLVSTQWDQTWRAWGLSFEYQDRRTEDGAGSVTAERTGGARLTRRIGDGGLARLEHQAAFDGPPNDRTTLGLEVDLHRRLALDVEGSTGDRGNAAQAGAILDFGAGRLYVRERFTDDPAGNRTVTSMGAESPLGRSSRVYTEYQWDRRDGDDRTLSLLGIQRNWEATPGVRVLLGAEHADIEGDAGSTDRSSVTGKVSWAPNDGLTAMTRAEWLTETGADERIQWTSLNRLDVGVSPDFTLLGRFRYSRTDDGRNDRIEARFQETSIGIAYRPVATDRFQGLARYTHLDELRPDTYSGMSSTRWLLNVISLEGSVDLTSRLQWYLKGAGRIREETVSPLPLVRTHSFLGIQRLDWTLIHPFDIGIEYRILAQREANDRRQGWVTELSRRMNDHLRLGVGYDFTDFSDNEFANDDYVVQGWYLRAHGRY